jgi:elongator complex protein 5
LVVDSVETIASDFGSTAKTIGFLSSLLSSVKDRSPSARLVLHVNASLLSEHADVLPMLLSSRLSPNLFHVIAHPPILLQHLSESYSTPLLPLSSPEKFWLVFTPFAARGPGMEAERLVFGSSGDGGSGSEVVFEVLSQGGHESGGTSRKTTGGVDRALEGWKDGVPCLLSDLTSLASLFKQSATLSEVSFFLIFLAQLAHSDTQDATPDPTKNLPFNLGLTSKQQQQRAQVPLPYAHEG